MGKKLNPNKNIITKDFPNFFKIISTKKKIDANKI